MDLYYIFNFSRRTAYFSFLCVWLVRFQVPGQVQVVSLQMMKSLQYQQRASYYALMYSI